jgi:histone H3/H4
MFIVYIIMVRTIPLNAMQRIMEEAGCERASDDAKIALRECLQSNLKEIIKKAHQYARHAGRNTILREDIELANR